MLKKLASKWLLALGCVAVFSTAMAADPPPSGTVTLTSKAVALGIGVSWGDGTLTFGGKTYPFSVEGLSVADLGVSSVTTSGEVFNLKNVADFSGNYRRGRSRHRHRRWPDRPDPEEPERRCPAPAWHAARCPSDAGSARRQADDQE